MERTLTHFAEQPSLDATKRFRAAGLAVCLLAAPTLAAGQTCNPSGTAVQLTANQHYFLPGSWFDYAQPTPLLGMSYEYLCAVNLGDATDLHGHLLSTEYCNVDNFTTVFQALQSSFNHVIRINAVFNSSPGVQLGNTSNGKPVPFVHEQVYPWFYINQQAGTYYWDLSQTDTTYLANLESVVCAAYEHSLVVEITLFDPWNPSWATSPFNAANAKSGQGFSEYQYFANLASDGSNSQNFKTRGYQKSGILAIVNRLKNYPNIIWEVANEPDLIPQAAENVAIANVVAWEETVVGWIQTADTAHPIMVNGHSASSYAWDVSGTTVEAAHYTQIHENYQSSQLNGAIDVQRGAWTQNQRWALALTENRSLPDCQAGCGLVNGRVVDDVRAEAWELVLGGGGIFNAYSYQMNYAQDYEDTTRDPKVASQQLLQLQIFLTAPADSWGDPIDLNTAAPAGCNVSGSWCTMPTGWGQPDIDPNDTPACFRSANAYWAAMASANSHVLYVHHGTTLNQQYGYVFDGFHELPCGNGGTTGFRTSLKVQVQTTGCWTEAWVDPRTGMVLSTIFAHLTAGASVGTIAIPYYKDDIAFVLSYNPSAGC